jgi:hypothetical protein
VHNCINSYLFRGFIPTVVKEPRIIENGSDYIVNWGDPSDLHVKIDNAHPVSGQIAARVTSDIMVIAGDPEIMSWQVSKEKMAGV